MTHQRQIQCKSKEIANCNIAVASETVIKRPTVKGELSVLFTLSYLLLFIHSSPFVLAIVLIDLMLEIAGLKEHFLCSPASHVPACYGKRLHSIITYYFLLIFFSVIFWLLHKQEPHLLLLGKLIIECFCPTLCSKGFSFVCISSRSCCPPVCGGNDF